MYNSWDTLKKEGSVTVELKQNVKSVSKLLPGHYNLENIAKVMNTMFRRYGYRGLETEINQPLGQLVIKNLVLVLVFGIERKLAIMTFVKKLTAPTTYFIHCDLIDTEQNLFNGKRKDLLAVFDVKGKPYEKVSYHATPQQMLRDCSTDQFINSITLSVKDQHGELFDFKGMPMVFELELK